MSAAESTVLEASPFLVARGTVSAVDRVSPTFVRITFTGADFDEFGDPERVLDQRIKLIFPPSSGRLPDLGHPGGDWWSAFLAIPEDERGSMRTYSMRQLRVDEGGTSVVVDFVLHLEPGFTGPASSWASQASVGDELLLIGPRRGRPSGGGIEYAPGDAREILLAGDETAAPAIARILEDIDRDAVGLAVIEVPSDADALSIDAPRGVDVRWVPRDGATVGSALIPTVLGELGATATVTVTDDGTEELLWETPVFSGSGEALDDTTDAIDRYFWIAGESSVVTTLRRHLVKDLGIHRSQVAFMGYWRRGVAMRG
ncbi:siderophore-interacting protein [Microbacterium schleiferi]|uniref:Siderophore-interacting protein n=1 Tax=Microbacterium schleiferi TaxID=69362 RepID=A0A7S8RIA7_9MICO|nr:siderophore-interacting protein [Microbacterium schleiferi]QPE05542.1 siderophore-interacting protein [Microbacterium schleiferi]